MSFIFHVNVWTVGIVNVRLNIETFEFSDALIAALTENAIFAFAEQYDLFKQ